VPLERPAVPSMFCVDGELGSGPSPNLGPGIRYLFVTLACRESTRYTCFLRVSSVGNCWL